MKINLSKVIIPEMPILDPKQIEAVFWDGNTAVIAGPGTGKTRTVHGKAVWVDEQNKDSQAITHMVEAAKEMQKRLGNIGNPRTIHSEGFHRLGMNFGDPFEEMVVPSPYPIVDWAIMDEGQDQFRKTYEVFESLGMKHFLVADSWQSLMRWNGADPSLVDEFIRKYNAKVVELDTNYRSATSIVELSNIFSGRNMKAREGAPLGLVYIGPDTPDFENLTILARHNKTLQVQAEFLQIKGLPHTLVVSEDGKRSVTNWKNGKSWRIRDPKEYLSTVLMTIHCAKGTEWKRVWVINWDPYGNLVEEDCCFYVAITRAIEELHIGTYFNNRFTRRIGC